MRCSKSVEELEFIRNTKKITCTQEKSETPLSSFVESKPDCSLNQLLQFKLKPINLGKSFSTPDASKLISATFLYLD